MGTCMGILSRGGRRGSTFSSVPTMRHKSLLTTASLKGASTVFATFILLHLTTTPTTSEPIEVDPLELLALLSRHDFIRGWEKGGIISQKRGPGSEFLGKRAPGSEFLGKRGSSTFNSPQFLYHKRAPGSEFLGKRALGSEFLGKRVPGSEFLGKRAPGSEFLGKRGHQLDYAHNVMQEANHPKGSSEVPLMPLQKNERTRFEKHTNDIMY